MKGNIRSWKVEAKRTLKGKYKVAIFAMVAVNALSMLATELGYNLFGGTSVFELIASNLVAFIATLIVCVFTAGLSYLYLNMARSKEYSYRDLIYFFKNHPDRVIVASFVLALISLIVSLPGFFIGDPGTTAEEVLAWSYKYAGTTLFAVVANLILTLPLSQVYYLLADDLELDGIAALKKSMKLMKGKILKYLFLQLSFLPWFFLSIGLMMISMFIPALVLLSMVGAVIIFRVVPYMEMASVFFYRDLVGDYGKSRDESLDIYNGYMGNMFNNSAVESDDAEVAEQYENARESEQNNDDNHENLNDYNAEA